LYFELWDLGENASDEVRRTLNTQISETAGVKFGNYIQSVDDALTLVPDEWSWEPLWQKILQQLREPISEHPDKMAAVCCYNQTPEGDRHEVLFPLPIAISMTALLVHLTMSQRRAIGLPLDRDVDCPAQAEAC
jgi:hypothetical protein